MGLFQLRVGTNPAQYSPFVLFAYFVVNIFLRKTVIYHEAHEEHEGGLR